MIRRILWLLPALLLPVSAQAANIFEDVGITAGPVLEWNPSARWRAMGDAGTAAFWDAAHAWANPALLGMATGLQYEAGSMDHDVFDFESARTTVGWGGLGLSTTGRPIPGLGKIDFDFFGIDESVRSWSVGVSASKLLATIPRHRGKAAPPFTRWIDVGLGYSEKHVKEDFNLSVFGEPETEKSRATARDLGILVRGSAPIGPARLDVAWGHADVNANEPRLTLGVIRTAREQRNGIAARVGWDPGAVQTRIPGWLRTGTSPILSLGGAMDFVHTTEFRDHFRDSGAELAVANILFGRVGRAGHNETWGLGVGIPLGQFAAVRWDHASRARAEGVPKERSNAWTVWMDPLAIFGAVR